MKWTRFALLLFPFLMAPSQPDIYGPAAWRMLKTLEDCDGAGEALQWDLATADFTCETGLGGGGGATTLDQSAGETDLRYDATQESYYFDTDGGGTRATDGTEPFVDTHIIEVPLDYPTIQDALESDECKEGSTTTDQGCTIRFKGTRAESVVISHPTDTAQRQWSITIEGVGAMGEQSAGTNNLCASTLSGDGTLDGSVITINDSIGVNLRNFCIDMDPASGNDPKYGIAVGTSTAGDTTTKHVLIEQIAFFGTGVANGANILLGNSDGGGFLSDTAFNMIRSVYMEAARTCLIVDATQTVTNYVENLNCANPVGSIGGINLIRGQIAEVRGLYYTPGAVNQTAINILNNSLGISTFANGTFEWDTDDGVIFNYDDSDGTGNLHAQTITGTRFNIQDIPTVRHKCINWDRAGTLNVIGNSFESDTSSSRTCEVFLRNADTVEDSYVTWIGNDIEWNGSQPDMVFDESSAGGDLVVSRDEHGIRRIGQNGRLRFEGSTIDDGFESDIVVTDPTADRTMTIPNANSNPVIPDTGAANQFLTAISSGGVISKAQPSFSNLSGTATDGQVSGLTEADEVVGTETDEALCSWEATGSLVECDLSVNAGTSLTADLEEESHASEHQNGGADEVATATPAANAIPKAGAGGFLADAFVDGSLEADEVNPTLGTQTQGNYVDNVTGDAEIVVTHTPAEGSEPALSIASSITRDAEAAAAYQPLDADLTSVAALTTTTGGRSILATTPADDQVYVGDSASAGTWRSIPDCGEAGTLNYTASTNSFSCLTDGGGGGGGNSVEQSIALSGGAGFFSQVVTGQSWVATNSEINCDVLGTTADGLTPEAISIGNLSFSVSDRVAGVGFTINVYSPNGLEGTIRAHCLGV